MKKSRLQELFHPSEQAAKSLLSLYPAPPNIVVGMTQLHLEVHPGGSTAGVRGV